MKDKIYIIIFISIVSFLIACASSRNTINIYNSLVKIETITNENIIYGTGFVYKIENDKDYILTNYHVVEDYNKIYIQYNGYKVEASLLDKDIYNDLAIITIEDTLGLKELKFSNAKENSNVFLSDADDSYNLLKGKIINNSLDNDIYDFNPIEVSFKVNYGNSGSPVVDNSSNVIGMLFLRDKESNLGYVIPSSFIEKFINSGCKRINLNITVKDTIKGVLISSISNDSILKDYGLIEGDIIVSINNNSINNINDYKNSLYVCGLSKISIDYYRGSSYKNIVLEF